MAYIFFTLCTLSIIFSTPLTVTVLSDYLHEDLLTRFWFLCFPNGGPEISFSLYHECLHLIAFTHAKVLCLPCHKFINPASPANDDSTVSVQFIPQWHKHLLLLLFLCLMHIYIKPQLRLTDTDSLQSHCCIIRISQSCWYLWSPWSFCEVPWPSSPSSMLCYNTWTILSLETDRLTWFFHSPRWYTHVCTRQHSHLWWHTEHHFLSTCSHCQSLST